MPEPKPDQSVRISSSRNQTLVFSNVTPPLYLSINPSFWGSSWKQIADMSKLTPQWCIFKSSPGNSNAARVETPETRSSRIPHYWGSPSTMDLHRPLASLYSFSPTHPPWWLLDLLAPVLQYPRQCFWCQVEKIPAHSPAQEICRAAAWCDCCFISPYCASQ